MFLIRFILCKWGIQICTVWLVGIAQSWLDKADLSTLLEKWNQQLPSNSWLRCPNKQGVVWEAESSSWGSSQNTEYVRSHCQHMAARLSPFMKLGPSVHHGECVSADKFLLGVRIKWVFHLSIHRPRGGAGCHCLWIFPYAVLAIQPNSFSNHFNLLTELQFTSESPEELWKAEGSWAIFLQRI